MLDKPILLDTFCKAGGCTKGYQRAGFYVVGVDIEPQPRYCGDEFIQADALKYLATADLSRYAAIHASPPCQAYSVCKRLKTARDDYPDLIGPTRAALMATGKPYVIENVQGAPLENPLMLCGSMFGLAVLRHRLFECDPPIWFAPHSCDHAGGALPMWWRSRVKKLATGQKFRYMTVAGNSFLVPEASRAMGIDWMSRKELSQAIPPAYTEWIGRHLIQELIDGTTN